MSAVNPLAEEFENHRARLQAVAYRMLGSPSEAEEAVQEAWLRLDRTAAGSVDNLGGWLTTVVGRVCLDLLRARRREQDRSTSLPDPIVTLETEVDPEHEALIADSVGLALLVVLDELTPAERLAFVLHDMFDLPFDEIAPIVGRSSAAARQLASRARRRVRGAAPEPDVDLRRQREVVDAFLAASRMGDFDALLRVLDPEVVLRTDVGPGPVSRPPVHGAASVAREVLARGGELAGYARHALVNGHAGIVVSPPGHRSAVVAFTVRGARIAAIDLVLDRDKIDRALRG